MPAAIAILLFVREPERILVAAAVVAGYAAFCAATSYAYRRRQYRRALAAALLSQRENAGSPVLVAFASQTGFAEQLAWRTAVSLQEAGVPVRVSPLGKLDGDAIATLDRALFVVSTTGEGDAPDSAAAFTRKVMSKPAFLSRLKYGVLALGDRSYIHYCGFGHALDSWLRHHGATPLFDIVEVDNGDEGALRHWQHHLGALAGSTEMADWTAPSYGRWQLSERRLLNSGSPGAPAFAVRLEPLDGPVSWRAGDIAEIGPRNCESEVRRVVARLELECTDKVLELLAARVLPHDEPGIQALAGLAPEALARKLKTLPHREYSIASLPGDGAVELVVRQMRHPNGRLGLGSGWLTEHAAVGSEIALRIRENRAFHPPEEDRPLILIGNGTGMAGLRAHLKARVASGSRCNWLLFGERTRACDFFYREEIEAWCAAGVIERLDLAFSRDQPERVYVQHLLRDAESEVRRWVDEGAAIYVCGSLEGMASGVGQVLTEILGLDAVEQMSAGGRYRRDVY